MEQFDAARPLLYDRFRQQELESANAAALRVRWTRIDDDVVHRQNEIRGRFGKIPRVQCAANDARQELAVTRVARGFYISQAMTLHKGMVS